MSWTLTILSRCAAYLSACGNIVKKHNMINTSFNLPFYANYTIEGAFQNILDADFAGK